MTIETSYRTSRERFRQAVRAAGGELAAVELDLRGPDGETLAIDVGSIGPRSAECCLVISSGLHGLEGPLGSAVQVSCLQRGLSASRPDRRLLLLHGLNPFGMAWRWRWDQDGIDLNRNFPSGGATFAGADPLYGRLDALLNPPAPRVLDGLRFRVSAAAALLRHGFQPIARAIASGQYDHPQGLFYGGAGPSWTHRVLDAHLESWLGEAVRIRHLDLHTGLGPYGRITLFGSPGGAPAGPDFWRRALPGWRDRLERSDDQYYPVRGDWGVWLERRFADRDYRYLCGEVGTYSGLSVLASLRADGIAWRSGDQARRRSPDRMRRALASFVPESRVWASRALDQAIGVASAMDAGLV